jgi:hypothetical protein
MIKRNRIHCICSECERESYRARRCGKCSEIDIRTDSTEHETVCDWCPMYGHCKCGGVLIPASTTKQQLFLAMRRLFLFIERNMHEHDRVDCRSDLYDIMNGDR